MATTNLGRVRFNMRGDYNPAANPLYSLLDLVSDGGGSFVYINDTPSNEPTSSTSHWQQIATMGGQDLVDAAVVARDAAIAAKVLAEGYAAQLAAGTASPAGTYANLAALNSGTPTAPNTAKIYITLDDGNWCYHNGTTWVAGGVYQATVLETDKTLTVSDAAADAKVTGDKVSELKSAINASLKVNKTPSQGYVNPSNGNIYGSGGTAYYKYITVDVDSNYTILYIAGSNESGAGMAFYKADGTFIADSGHDATNTLQVLSVPADAKKAKLSYSISKESVFFTYLALNTENLYDIIKTLNTSIGTINGSISTINTSIERMIEVDRTNAKTGYVNPSNGNVIDGYSGYKYVVINAFEGCTILYQNYANEIVSGIAFYMADGTFISGQTGSTSEQVINVPHGTAVAKIAFRETQMSFSYAKIYENPSKMLPKAPVIVDASGGGDYTSFLAALKGTADDIPLLIKKGTYNIIAEYESYYGNTYFTNYTGYSGTTDKFNRGLWLGKGRKIHGESGVVLQCEYTGDNSNVPEYFSVIANDSDTLLENVTIKFSGVRYAIHDDYQPEYGKVEWKNIHFDGVPNKSSVIGGGMGLYCLYFIDGCTFENNSKDWDINYHASNNDATSNVCTLRVTNCFGSKRFGVWKNGPATTVSPCYVSNSKFLEIINYTPSGVTAAENVSLTKWCNQEGA